MTRDYFYYLQSHRRPVNYLSTAVQLTNRLLHFWADGGFVYYKRVISPSSLVCSQSLIVIITSWFAIGLDEVRTRRILREKADCKQSRGYLYSNRRKIVTNTHPRERAIMMEVNYCLQLSFFFFFLNKKRAKTYESNDFSFPSYF